MNALAPAHPNHPLDRFAIAVALALAAVLAGCATPLGKPGGSSLPPMDPGGAEPAPVSPLVTEQRWLDEWFRGTPVVIAMADSGTLAVDVPLANSFGAGSSSIKPALAAVLDRVATSLRRQPTMRVIVAAPADANGAAALAHTRAQQVRDHLAMRGVATTRMTGVGTARAGTAVQLRMLVAPQAIGRLDDATLPVPVQGVKPVAATPASGVKR